MKRYQLSKAGVDVVAGITRFGGNKEVYEKMLTHFTQDPSYSHLVEAMAGKDVQAAFLAAHSLKGVAGNLSMNRLLEHISPLVEILRAGSMEHTEELMAQVEQDYKDIMGAM